MGVCLRACVCVCYNTPCFSDRYEQETINDSAKEASFVLFHRFSTNSKAFIAFGARKIHRNPPCRKLIPPATYAPHFSSSSKCKVHSSNSITSDNKFLDSSTDYQLSETISPLLQALLHPFDTRNEALSTLYKTPEDSFSVLSCLQTTALRNERALMTVPTLPRPPTLQLLLATTRSHPLRKQRHG